MVYIIIIHRITGKVHLVIFLCRLDFGKEFIDVAFKLLCCVFKMLKSDAAAIMLELRF